MARPHAKDIVKQGTLFFLGAICTAIIGYYLHLWLGGAAELTYFLANDALAEKGMIKTAGGVSLLVDAVEYGGKRYTKLRAMQFVILNQGNRGVPEGSRFVFVGEDDSSVPSEAVVAVAAKGTAATGEVVLAERKDMPGIGPSIALKSALPGHGKLTVDLVLDVAESPRSREMRIDLRRVASSQHVKFSRLSEETVTFTFHRFILWLALTAAAYAGIWLLINIFTGNHSTGARIVNALCEWIFDWGFIEEAPTETWPGAKPHPSGPPSESKGQGTP